MCVCVSGLLSSVFSRAMNCAAAWELFVSRPFRHDLHTYISDMHARPDVVLSNFPFHDKNNLDRSFIQSYL